MPAATDVVTRTATSTNEAEPVGLDSRVHWMLPESARAAQSHLLSRRRQLPFDPWNKCHRRSGVLLGSESPKFDICRADAIAALDEAHGACDDICDLITGKDVGITVGQIVTQAWGKLSSNLARRALLTATNAAMGIEDACSLCYKGVTGVIERNLKNCRLGDLEGGEVEP